jgi:hypothetical protein
MDRPNPCQAIAESTEDALTPARRRIVELEASLCKSEQGRAAAAEIIQAQDVRIEEKAELESANLLLILEVARAINPNPLPGGIVHPIDPTALTTTDWVGQGRRRIMPHRPKILGSRRCPGGRCVAFEKHDGTNLHWEWDREFGWHSFGTRRDEFTLPKIGIEQFV